VYIISDSGLAKLPSTEAVLMGEQEAMPALVTGLPQAAPSI